MPSPNARWNKHSKPTSVGTCILLISRNIEKLVNNFIENTRSDTTCETVDTIINTMDATLNTMDTTTELSVKESIEVTTSKSMLQGSR